ncbi:MFS transporter [Carnobacterium sp. AT7]|uniref:MFS transporter n=1 Tax=Carnobacterium sp. AT7 TaxID=333990 RepID=UPI001E4EBFCF|nr:MFS transporter [Carnobacterium sp. AT7]
MVSVTLSTLGFGFVLFGFSSAGSRGWDDTLVLATIVIGIVSLVLFSVRQLRSSDPFLNLRVFNNKIFTMTSFINIIVTMMLYADMILLPMYLQTGRGFSAVDSGLLLLPGALVNAVLSPIVGKLYDRYGAKPLFIIGLIFVIPSMWVVTSLTAATTFTFLMIRTIFLRIGLSFITMPLSTAGLNALPIDLINHGTAVNNTVRQIAGAVGTAVVITIYSSKAALYAGDLAAQGITENIKSLTSIFAASKAYYFMTILAILAMVLTFLTPLKKPTPVIEQIEEFEQ